MPKVSLLQESFTGGEFSPLAQGQASAERYRKALNRCLNYVPTLQGPLIRRPGTKFAGFTQNQSTPPVLIPFVFSQTQAYMLEFGGQYIAFYANNAALNTVGQNFYVSGSMNDGQHFFFGSRPVYQAKPNEILIASSVGGNGSIFMVPSPYLASDVASLKFGQSNDTLYLTHANYPTFKLQRFGQYDWRLAQVYLQDGPYLAFNSYQQTGDTPTGVTLQPTAFPGGGIAAGAAGSTFSLQTGPGSFIAGVNNSNGTALITTAAPHGLANGSKVVVQNCSGAMSNFQQISTYNLTTNSGSPIYYTINVTTPSQFKLIGVSGSSVVMASGLSAVANIYPALFLSNADVGRAVGLQQGVVANAGQRVFGYTTSWLGDASTIGFYCDASQSLLNTSTVIYWQLGCYGGGILNGGTLPSISPFNGTSPGGSLGSSSFPSATCFHQDRLFLTGSTNYPQQIDGSQIGNFESFSPSVGIGSTALQVQANNAVQFTLNSTDENKLQWLKSTTQGLVSASYSSEWVITPGAQATAINPTNINAQQTSYFGSADIDAVMTGNAVLYVQRALRKVREMNYFFQVGTYRSSDMTILAEHITLPTITKLVVQKETQPLVWGLTSNGQLVSMTYNRDDVTIEAGWSRHQLGGRSDASGSPPIVSSMATIPDPTNSYDQLWLVTKRYLASSSTQYCIEYMTNFFQDNMIQDQAVQGDCAASFDSPKSITSVVNSGIYTIFNFTPSFQSPPATLYTVGFQNIIGLNSSVVDANGNTSAINPLNGQKFQAFSTSASAFYLSDLQNNPVSLKNNTAYVGSGVFRQCSTTVTGAYWLSGETVNILADGANATPVVVGSGGSVALPFSTAIAQVGYAFKSQGQLLRAAVGSAQGSAIGSTRRVNRAAFQLHNVGDLSYGMSFSNLISWNFMQADVVNADTAIPLFNGIIRDGIEAPYDFDNMLCFEQNSMLPGSIVSITSFFEEEDV